MAGSSFDFVKRTLSSSTAVSLADLLHSSDLSPRMPCGGNHRCGKCRVKVTGDVLPPSKEELALLSREDAAQGIRLACFAQVQGTVTVELPSESMDTLSLVSLPRCRPGGNGSGLAVDIGTTTIAMQLYDCSSGRLLGEDLAENRQRAFGADVISRIEYANRHTPARLEEAIHRQLEEMAELCLRRSGVSAPDRVVITGNTTMLHFWERLDPRGIAVSPFVPQSLFGCESRYPLCGALPFLPHCVGAYVGGDITCAVLASGMLQAPERTSLLIDLGTNGEIALYHRGKLHCASTALGPAFEGASLSCGMPASPGAVCEVHMEEDGGVSFSTIAAAPPVGICGSGILDVIRLMLDQGILDETGRLCGSASTAKTEAGEPAWDLPGTGLRMTQQDIRQIQLAKAAVCAGIQTLLETLGLTCEDIERFYIAGGFGHSMNVESAARVGLFPSALKTRVQLLGNASLSGAVFLLLEPRARDVLDQMRESAGEIPLSGNSTFSEYYIDNMLFETI